MTALAKIDIAASHRERLGCSKIAQALGLSRWGSTFQLWEMYTNRAPWPDIGNQLRVALGEPMEDVLRPFVEQRLGCTLRRDHREYLHPSLPMVGHVDYRASIGSIAKRPYVRPVVDMKTSLGWGAKHRFGDDGTDQVDDDVLLQMQGYLMLTGADTAYVAALVPGPELKIFTVMADKECHALIEDGITAFWWHVENDVPPAPATLEDARRRWPQHQEGQTIVADGDALQILAELRDLAARQKALDYERDLAELAIKARLGNAEALIGPDGKLLCAWKTQASTRIDTAAIKAAGLYETYTKTTTSRVFRLKGEK
jgi:predicted phage-related endonuclease